MPEIHAGIQSMLVATLAIVGVVGLVLQAVSFIVEAILRVQE